MTPTLHCTAWGASDIFGAVAQIGVGAGGKAHMANQLRSTVTTLTFDARAVINALNRVRFKPSLSLAGSQHFSGLA